MSRMEDFSDEYLNAFIDGELDDAEREHLLDELRRNEALNARLCDLQKVRALLQHAYRCPPEPPRSGETATRRRRSSRLIAGIAASLALGVGVLLGWSMHGMQHPTGNLLEIAQSMQLGGGVDVNRAGMSDNDPWRVVLHVTTADTHRLQTLLDEAEGLLARHADGAARSVAVEVLANGRGLDLLRADTSHFAERIRQLQARYDNLTFKACSNAIKRLKREKNIDVILLPEAKVVPTAIGEVIQRQREGWAYVQI